MSNSKNLLILKASEDIHEAEVSNIQSQVELYGIRVTVVEALKNEDITAALYKGVSYDYIYLATHGCEDSWGNISGTIDMTWIEFGAHVCASGVSKPGAIFLHSCCRGGLEKVGFDMFACCEQIQLVCGPRFNVKPHDLVMGFNLFLYNIEIKGVDPIVSAQKVLNAIDLRLHCMDRLEYIHTPHFGEHCRLYEDTIQKAFDSHISEHIADEIEEKPEV